MSSFDETRVVDLDDTIEDLDLVYICWAYFSLELALCKTHGSEFHLMSGF